MHTKRAPDSKKHIAILRSAIQLFLKNGYAKTSMDAIALRAKVTKQTVYSHYTSKDALFTAIINELAQKHSPSAQPQTGKRQSVEERLYEMGLNFLNMVSSSEGLSSARLVIAEAHRYPKLAQRYYENGSRRILNLLAAYLEQENKDGRLHIPVPGSAASYFFSMLKGNYYLRVLLNIKPLPSAGEKESHVRECVDIFMRLYGGKDAMRTRNIL